MKGLIETLIILGVFAAMVVVCWGADHKRNKQLINRTKKEKDHA